MASPDTLESSPFILPSHLLRQTLSSLIHLRQQEGKGWGAGKENPFRWTDEVKQRRKRKMKARERERQKKMQSATSVVSALVGARRCSNDRQTDRQTDALPAWRGGRVRITPHYPFLTFITPIKVTVFLDLHILLYFLSTSHSPITFFHV